MPSSTEKQARFMSACSHNADFAKRAGIPQKVCKKFHNADQGKKWGAGGKKKVHESIQYIHEQNYVKASELIHEMLEEIVAQKIVEVKKMIAARMLQWAYYS